MKRTYNIQYKRAFSPRKIRPRVRQPTHRAGKIFRAEKMLEEYRNPFDGVRNGLA